MEYPLGTWRGVGVLFDSAVFVSEIEITFAEDGMHVRHATRRGKHEMSYARSELLELTPGDIKSLSLLGEPERVAGGYRLADENSYLLFQFELPEAPQMRHFDLNASDPPVGSTILFSPAQVERGLHTQFMMNIEQVFGRPGGIPRL